MVVWIIFKRIDIFNNIWTIAGIADDVTIARAIATALGKPPRERRESGEIRYELGSSLPGNFLQD